VARRGLAPVGRTLPLVPAAAATAPTAPILCVGGVVADRVVRLEGPPITGTSNPASVVTAPGGVARNVAENLARLGHRPSLVSVIGDDTTGASLVTHARAAGVDPRWVRTEPGQVTAEYLAILAPDGELVLGVAVMEVLDALTVADLDAAWPAPFADGGRPKLVVLDCNPPGPVLAHAVRLAREQPGSVRLAVVAVSAPKVTRLPADLSGVDLLFCTRDEAQAWLAGRAAVTGVEALDDAGLAAALRRSGARSVVLTRGATGALALDDDGLVEVPASQVPVVDVTGGGDALVAGTVAALVAGHALGNAVRHGVALAELTIGVEGAVRPDLGQQAPALASLADPS
jgi:pseudouridine kinase